MADEKLMLVRLALRGERHELVDQFADKAGFYAGRAAGEYQSNGDSEEYRKLEAIVAAYRTCGKIVSNRIESDRP